MPSLASRPDNLQSTPARSAEGAIFHHRCVVVVIPAYNEERTIASVVLKMLRYPVTVLVVDDGSRDETAYLARQAGAVVLRLPLNSGKAAALNAGFAAARKLKPEVVVTIDADGQHRPEELPAVVRPALEDGADIVIGSRYLVHTSHVPTHRLWGHAFFNLLTAAASGVGVSDSQSGYRAFSPRALACDHFHSHGFTVESESQFLAREHGLKVVEVPITIRYADPPKRPVLHQGLSVLNGVLRLTGQYRPLLYFGLPGALFLLASLLWGSWVVERFYQLRQLATGSAMASMLLFITGLVLLSTGFILHSIRGLLQDMLRGHVHSRRK